MKSKMFTFILVSLLLFSSCASNKPVTKRYKEPKKDKRNKGGYIPNKTDKTATIILLSFLPLLLGIEIFDQ